MTFPRFDFERYHSKAVAKRAVESHGTPLDALIPSTREMKEREHTGIELTGVELAYLKNAVSERMRTVEHRVSELGRAVNDGTAPNPENAKAERIELQKELDFLRHNLGEKLFQDAKGDADNEVAI